MKREAAERAQEAQLEQQRLDEQEEKKRLELLERRAAEQLESELGSSLTLGR